MKNFMVLLISSFLTLNSNMSIAGTVVSDGFKVPASSGSPSGEPTFDVYSTTQGGPIVIYRSCVTSGEAAECNGGVEKVERKAYKEQRLKAGILKNFDQILPYLMSNSDLKSSLKGMDATAIKNLIGRYGKMSIPTCKQPTVTGNQSIDKIYQDKYKKCQDSVKIASKDNERLQKFDNFLEILLAEMASSQPLVDLDSADPRAMIIKNTASAKEFLCGNQDVKARQETEGGEDEWSPDTDETSGAEEVTMILNKIWIQNAWADVSSSVQNRIDHCSRYCAKPNKKVAGKDYSCPTSGGEWNLVAIRGNGKFGKNLQASEDNKPLAIWAHKPSGKFYIPVEKSLSLKDARALCSSIPADKDMGSFHLATVDEMKMAVNKGIVSKLSGELKFWTNSDYDESKRRTLLNQKPNKEGLSCKDQYSGELNCAPGVKIVDGKVVPVDIIIKNPMTTEPNTKRSLCVSQIGM